MDRLSSFVLSLFICKISGVCEDPQVSPEGALGRGVQNNQLCTKRRLFILASGYAKFVMNASMARRTGM